ncbi:MAG: baseplate J/gp47 family protein [bacterium]|nr:baseplate J/gp47 family protein [bacterium]
MDSATIDQLMTEIGLGDENAIDGAIDQNLSGTIYAEAARTKNSVLFNIFYALFREPYRLFRESVKAMLPQLFISSATGTWLERFAEDYDLSRDPGAKAVFELQVMKTNGQPLNIPVGTIFYVLEPNPRQYKTTQEYSFAVDASEVVGGDPDLCLIEVEALEMGSRYNVAAGQISKTLGTTLPIDSITNLSSVQGGRDLETDDALRDRIFAKKWSQNLQYGVDAKYLAALESVSAVKYAKLESVTPSNGILNYVVYGAGTIHEDDVALAQAALDAVLMSTDVADVTPAASYGFNLTVVLHAAVNQVEVTKQIEAYFEQIERGADFYSSLLALWLYERFPELVGTPIEITPDLEELIGATFFYPTINLQVVL